MDNVKKALSSLSQTEASRRELAAAMIEWIKPNHLTSDLISLFLDTRQLKAGDPIIKRLRKPGIKVRKMVPGTVHLADEIAVTERINYTFDSHIVKVMANQWDLERGDLGSVQEIREEMTAKLVDFYVGKVFALLSTVWNNVNTPSNYAEVATSLSKSALDTAIDYISYKTGGVKAIVGVKNTLLPLVDFAGYGTYDSHKQFSDEILTETLRNGWIGQYRGVRNILGLSQVWDDPESNSTLLPENYVLVIGNNAGEFVTYGEPKWKEYIDNQPTPPYFVMETYQEWGMVVDRAEAVYVIKVV